MQRFPRSLLQPRVRLNGISSDVGAIGLRCALKIKDEVCRADSAGGEKTREMWLKMQMLKLRKQLSLKFLSGSKEAMLEL